MLTKLPRFFTALTKILFGPDRLVKKNRKEKHQITRILSKCEGPKVKSKQCRPQLAIWVVSFHALWCQELWNGSTPFQLKHRVIYYRVLTIKPLEDGDLEDCALFYACSLLKGQKKSKPVFQADVFSKKHERILLYYYETSDRLVFIHFLEEIEDTKKTFRN